MAKKKALTSEKAAEQISIMIHDQTAKDAADAVKQRPELEAGLKHFEAARPVSSGSGPAFLAPRR